MTLKELLDSDVEVIGQRLLVGLAWWRGELESLVPSGLRQQFGGRPRLVVAVNPDAGALHWSPGGERVEGPAGKAPIKVSLAMAPDQVLVRSLQLPRLPAADIRRIVTLDIDRLTPFFTDAVYADVVIEPLADGETQQTVLLAVTPRETAHRALDLAITAGLQPGALMIEDQAGRRFDFLPAIRQAGGGASGRARYWWAAAAALLAVNLGGLVLRDMADVSALRSTVEAQAATASAAMQVRRRVEEDRAARAALLARRDSREPLRMLDAATRMFPAGAWVQRLEWNGTSIRLVGYKPDGFDVSAAVRGSPAFTNPRELAVQSPAKGLPQPFDVTGDAERRGRP